MEYEGEPERLRHRMDTEAAVAGGGGWNAEVTCAKRGFQKGTDGFRMRPGLSDQFSDCVTKTRMKKERKPNR